MSTRGIWPRSAADARHQRGKSRVRAMSFRLTDALIAEANAPLAEALADDYDHLGNQLARRGAAHSVGHSRAPRGAARQRGITRPVLRFHELEYVSGSTGAAALVQVREPESHRCGGAA